MRLVPRRIATFSLLAFLIPFAFYVLTMNGIWSADYQESILGLQYSMWAHHSFSLGNQSNPIVTSVDTSLFHGNYYSAISPGFAILSFPFAAYGFILDGNKLSFFGGALLMDELFLSLVSALAAFFVYKICRLYSEPLPSLLASLSLALGTSVWPFATVIFIHGASLLFSVASVYLILSYFERNSDSTASQKLHYVVLAGLSLGIASFVEYAALFLFVPLFGYLIVMSRNVQTHRVSLKARLTSFSLPFLLGPTLQLVYNSFLFGNPLTFPESLKVGNGSSLLEEFNLLGVPARMMAYAISPYRGLLFFSPVLVIGVYGLYMMMTNSEKKLKLVAILFSSLFLIILIFYSAWTDWAGGLAYGPRFLILGLPYLAVPISIFLSRYKSMRSRMLFIFLFILSTVVEGIGALTTPFSVSGTVLTYQPLLLNIPWLLQGKLDTWWLHALTGTNVSTFQLFAITLFLLEFLLVVSLALKIHPTPLPYRNLQVSNVE